MSYGRLFTAFVLSLLLVACDGEPQKDWAIAIHGGAGSIRAGDDSAFEKHARASLQAALQTGVTMLESGSSSLDVVEAVIVAMEDDPLFNAGRGAVFNRDGINELDASIMNGRDLSCGAVAGVRRVKNPIRLARQVMEQTRHVLLAGEGAETFGEERGVEFVDPSYFFTQRRWNSLNEKLAEEFPRDPEGGSTVGVVALDRNGDLAAGTSTGGLTAKRYGRIGDSPIIGAGTYADNRTCAISGTGVGEEYIRNGIAHGISAAMELGGMTLEDSMRRAIEETLKPGDGGTIGVDFRGNISMQFNT
ncbi:MAG: isoaspartyl peptidase/L-asparaginase, partial [Acidobacteriota bacterium]|nr:isoaspartyl peptidase/L-asparaginase [Acidobacteriota bacterium]